MALYDINSKIDSSNIIRRTSTRASKDKAIARIALPFDDEFTQRRTLIRSKSVAVKKSIKEVDEIEQKFRTRLSISCNEDDDDDEDDFDAEKCESESSEPSESSSSEDYSSEDLPTTTIATPKLKRNKTFAGGRPSVASVKKITFNKKQMEKKKMTLTSFFEEIPCRDNEFNQIYLSISTSICKKDGGCIFVVGVPGTGKTATVSAVLDCLESAEASIPEFTRIMINGMHVTEAREVYSLIYKELTNKNVSKKRAVASLENELFKKSSSKKSIVILIDEIDQLHTKKEDVLYKIFGWTQRAGSRLVIVAIANTMDMPERLSENKVTSRSGVTRYIFQPYNHEQLLTILKCKLSQQGSMENVDSNALEFAAKKVAAASGDVRRILEIFRRIIELQKTGKKIDISLIDFILKEMYAHPTISALRDNCSVQEKLFLRALLYKFRTTGIEEAKLKDVMLPMADICKSENVKMPNSSQIMAILISLGSYKLIHYDSLANDIHLKIRLNCPQENVNFALNNQ